MNHLNKLLAVLALLLSGCSSLTVQNYGVAADANYALKQLKVTEAVFMGEISNPSNSEISCRMMGPIKFANNMTAASYIKKALEDELKLSGTYASKAPKVVLGGTINKLEMSSTQGMSRGFWLIDLTIRSSNGKSIKVVENYQFESGFDGNTACFNTTTAFMPAVQNLITKLVNDSQFKELVTPSN